MQELLNNVKEYTDKNFAHVFVLTIMLALPFIVYDLLEPAGLWTVFLVFYLLTSAAMGHFRRSSKEFRKLNLDSKLWQVP